jgi:cellulose synthase/poly-beta-1,6-N-acetylglucosamine synthase-like glycosyltransferase
MDGKTPFVRSLARGTGQEDYVTSGSDSEKIIPDHLRSLPRLPKGDHATFIPKHVRTLYCHGGASTMQNAGLGITTISYSDGLDRGWKQPLTWEETTQQSPWPLIKAILREGDIKFNKIYSARDILPTFRPMELIRFMDTFAIWAVFFSDHLRIILALLTTNLSFIVFLGRAAKPFVKILMGILWMMPWLLLDSSMWVCALGLFGEIFALPYVLGSFYSLVKPNRYYLTLTTTSQARKLPIQMYIVYLKERITI